VVGVGVGSGPAVSAHGWLLSGGGGGCGVRSSCVRAWVAPFRCRSRACGQHGIGWRRAPLVAGRDGV